MEGKCDTCANGHMEYGHFTGTPVFIHADGTREVYYECDCMELAEDAEVSA